MEEWERCAGIGAIIAVWLFILFTLCSYFMLLYTGQVDLFLPIKVLAVIGLTYWVLISFVILVRQKSGGIGKTLQFCSLISSSVIAIYAFFVSSLFVYTVPANFTADESIWSIFLLSSAVIIIGLLILTHYTFKK